MKIGIIGIGSIGGTLARQLSAAGHDVRVANSRGPEAVRAFAETIGATPADREGAIEGAELVILSIPIQAAAELPQTLFAGLAPTTPVVITSNYYPELGDPSIAALDAGAVESVWVAEQLGRPLIKAFNNILAYSLAELGRPQGGPNRLAIAVAGDDAAKKRRVMDVIDELGFDPVDSGTLAASWRQQPSTPAYCCDYDAPTTRKALDQAIEGEAPKKRARLPELFGQLGDNPTHEEIVAMNRAANSVDGANPQRTDTPGVKR